MLNVELKIRSLVNFSNAVFQWGSGRKNRLNDKSIRSLVGRWLTIFRHHGVPRHQIPRLLAQFKLSLAELDEEAELANWLTPELQDAACALFNVRLEWLVNGEGGILETALLDRSVDSWIATLERALGCDDMPDLIVCRTEETEIDECRGQGGALVLRWRVGEIAGGSIWAYQPVFTIRHWCDDESLFLATRAMLVADALGVHLVGVTVPNGAIIPLAEGRHWPEVIFDKCWFHSWYPQDYTYGPNSPRAKGLDTLKWVQCECERDGSDALLREACARRQSPAGTREEGAYRACAIVQMPAV